MIMHRIYLFRGQTLSIIFIMWCNDRCAASPTASLVSRSEGSVPRFMQPGSALSASLRPSWHHLMKSIWCPWQGFYARGQDILNERFNGKIKYTRHYYWTTNSDPWSSLSWSHDWVFWGCWCLWCGLGLSISPVPSARVSWTLCTVWLIK